MASATDIPCSCIAITSRLAMPMDACNTCSRRHTSPTHLGDTPPGQSPAYSALLLLLVLLLLHPLNGLFSRTTSVSRYQKGKNSLDKRWWGFGMQWHHISWTICKQSAPRSRQITTPTPHHSVFYRPDALPDAQPTASKHWRQWRLWNKQRMKSVRTISWTDLLKHASSLRIRITIRAK